MSTCPLNYIKTYDKGVDSDLNDSVALVSKRLSMPVILIFNSWEVLALESLTNDSGGTTLGLWSFMESLSRKINLIKIELYSFAYLVIFMHQC